MSITQEVSLVVQFMSPYICKDVVKFNINHAPGSVVHPNY